MTDLAVVPRRTIAVVRALEGADIGCAVGGALALAYHVAEPRSTQDIDLNIALVRADAPRALTVLPSDVPWTSDHLAQIDRDGQVRIMWPVADEVPVPLDLFFAEHDFHRVVAGRTIMVPLLDSEIPIITATDLVVFKVLGDRGKDWVDIEEMVRYKPPSLDVDEAAHWIGQIVGVHDTRIARLWKLVHPLGLEPRTR